MRAYFKTREVAFKFALDIPQPKQETLRTLRSQLICKRVVMIRMHNGSQGYMVKWEIEW